MHGQGLKKKAIHSSHFQESTLSNQDNPYSSDLLWIQEDLQYFRFPKLSQHPGLSHRVFTRWGGVSDPPYNSLNASYTVEDRPGNVDVNLKKIQEALKAEHLMFMAQEHGENIVTIRKDSSFPRNPIPSADAMITNVTRLALMVKQADCQGIVIFDPEREVLANVHCGWRGNVHNIPGKVVTRMTRDFGCRPSHLLAAIGPSLGPCCAEFAGYKDIFPAHFKAFLVRQNYFDLWAVSCSQLESAGLKRENIEVSGICTRCRTDLFFSYRAEGKTGRFATVAMLRS
jgi:YfiH family protein